MIKRIFFAMALAVAMLSCSGSKANEQDEAANAKENEEMTTPTDTTSAMVKFETTMGSFTVLLYGDTPGHRDNFLKLVRNHDYDSLLFHRVINQFMIQGGDPESKHAPAGQQLGSGDIGGTIPAEIIYPKHWHKRGALAAARTGDQINPERRSSGSQFYVVTGRKFSEEEVKDMMKNGLAQEFINANRNKIMALRQAQDQAGLAALEQELIKWLDARVDALDPQIIKDYTTIGGAPHLDGQYTVYGEVIDGMDTIDKIEKVATDGADRPLEDVRIISAEIIPNE